MIWGYPYNGIQHQLINIFRYFFRTLEDPSVPLGSLSQPLRFARAALGLLAISSSQFGAFLRVLERVFPAVGRLTNC